MKANQSNPFLTGRPSQRIFAAIQASKDPHETMFAFYGYISLDLVDSLPEERIQQILAFIEKYDRELHGGS